MKAPSQGPSAGPARNAGTAARPAHRPAAHAAGKLTASFTSADNGSWWKGTYIVRNATTTAVTGWTLEFDLPPGATVSGTYNGQAPVTGSHVSATNAYYNATVQPNSTTEPYSFWFIGNGPNAAPLNCRINGDKCDGTPDVPPGAPGTPQLVDATAHSLALSWTVAKAGDFPVASYEVLSGSTVLGTATGAATTLTGPHPGHHSLTVRAKDTRGQPRPGQRRTERHHRRPGHRHRPAEHARQPARHGRHQHHRRAGLERRHRQPARRRLRRLPGRRAGADRHHHLGHRRAALPSHRVHLHREGPRRRRQQLRRLCPAQRDHRRPGRARKATRVGYFTQ